MKVNKLMKRATMFLLVMVFLTQGMFVSAQSAPVEFNSDFIEIMPLWENVSSISLDLSYRNGNIGGVATIRGAAGTTSINATLTLERRTIFGTWTTVDTWTGSSNDTRLTVSGTAPGSRGVTYRLTVTATVVRNGVSETVTTSTQGSF